MPSPDLISGTEAVEPGLDLFVDQLMNRSRLNKAERDALLNLPVEVSKVDAHRDIVRLGETVNRVSVVVEGVVARFGQNADGERQITALHIAGDAPDLHLVVMPSDTCPLQALSETTILRIPHEAMREVAARFHVVAEAFWRHCSVDAARTAQWVINTGRRDAKTRISHLLCEMAVRCNAHADEGEVTFPFPLTQTHLADITGITSVHVNRTLKALAAQSYVVISGRKAHIPDWNRLVKRAEFDAGYLQAGCQPGERLRMLD